MALRRWPPSYAAAAVPLAPSAPAQPVATDDPDDSSGEDHDEVDLQRRRGCACCDCRRLLLRLVFGGAWFGRSQRGPEAAAQRCCGCISSRGTFVSLRGFTLTDRDLHLILKQCDYYKAYRSPGAPEPPPVPRYRFRMVVGGVEVGNIQLRLGHGEDLERYAGHLGYYVAPPHRGHRLAQRSCVLLLELARWHGMNTLWCVLIKMKKIIPWKMMILPLKTALLYQSGSPATLTTQRAGARPSGSVRLWQIPSLLRNTLGYN